MRDTCCLLLFFLLPHALKGKQVEKEAHSGYCHYEPGARVHNGVRLNSNSYGVCHSSKPNCGDATPPRVAQDSPCGIHDKPRKGQGEDKQENNENGKHFYRPLSVFYEVPAFGTSSP